MATEYADHSICSLLNMKEIALQATSVMSDDTRQEKHVPHLRSALQQYESGFKHYNHDSMPILDGNFAESIAVGSTPKSLITEKVDLRDINLSPSGLNLTDEKTPTDVDRMFSKRDALIKALADKKGHVGDADVSISKWSNVKTAALALKTHVDQVKTKIDAGNPETGLMLSGEKSDKHLDAIMDLQTAVHTLQAAIEAQELPATVPNHDEDTDNIADGVNYDGIINTYIANSNSLQTQLDKVEEVFEYAPLRHHKLDVSTGSKALEAVDILSKALDKVNNSKALILSQQRSFKELARLVDTNINLQGRIADDYLRVCDVTIANQIQNQKNQLQVTMDTIQNYQKLHSKTLGYTCT
jgi:hypothetical protein